MNRRGSESRGNMFQELLSRKRLMEESFGNNIDPLRRQIAECVTRHKQDPRRLLEREELSNEVVPIDAWIPIVVGMQLKIRRRQKQVRQH